MNARPSPASGTGSTMQLRAAVTVQSLIALACLAGNFASDVTARAGAADPRPNFLLILADDCTCNDLPLYGGQNAQTPHLDSLARQGLTFNRAYVSRPAEELYHTAADPSEMKNLASDPRCAEIKARLCAELDRWLAAQGDPGIPQDTHEAHRAARQGKHRYFPKP